MPNIIRCIRSNSMYNLELKEKRYTLYKGLDAILSFNKTEDNPIRPSWHFGGRVLEVADIQFHSMDSQSIIEGLQTCLSEDYDSFHVMFFNESSEDFIDIFEHKIQLGNMLMAAELRLHPHAPFSIIRMYPYFRHGEMTPWGGDKLHKLFDKPIPDNRTGESLEISAIPNMESQDDHGNLLSELLAKYGEGFVGKDFVGERFPLLLKLLDAKGLLSIQVHPDDSYAKLHENGKLGKEEAWVVLDCEEDAQLVYGLAENVTPEQLANCLRNGESPENLVRFVKANKGDIFYMAPGTVHALGSGMVIYEIQQSSDVTYRMWDWARKDANGNMRELHIEDSINCIKYGQNLEIKQVPTAVGKHKIVDAESFVLCAVNIEDTEFLENDGSAFLLFTPLDSMNLLVGEDVLALDKGESVYIPANIKRIDIEGKGLALVAKPKKKS